RSSPNAIWPHPQQINISNDLLYIRPNDLAVYSNLQTCDIIAKIIERYKSIFFPSTLDMKQPLSNLENRKMSTKSSRKNIEQKKKQILNLLNAGTLITTEEAPSSSNGEFWSNLLRIRQANDTDMFEPFVQCNICKQILSYEPKNGTNSLSQHVHKCLKKTTTSKTTKSIQKYLKKDPSVSLEDKQKITIACAKFCAFDMQSFNTVKGDGFQQLCQTLIELGYKFRELKAAVPSATFVLPDPTNISRRIQFLANEYRLKLIQILKEDFKTVKLVGVSSDLWKNRYTSDNYLTINLHYIKDKKPITFMLSTLLFVGSKTGDNIVRMMKNVLISYEIDPEEMHIIYLTDSGPNFVCGLKDEVHLRCHGLNLVLQYSLGELCPIINSMIKACSELVGHFKRCELNALLSTSLKQQCETRWNTIHEMLQIDEGLLKDLTKLLSYFKIASEQLSSDQEPTLHLVLPWINKLKSYCEIKINDSEAMKQVKKLILEHIQQKIWLTQLHEIATFLHPLTKNLASFSQCERDHVHQATREMLKTVGIIPPQQSSIIITNKTTETKQKKKETI
ncbi:unnamed protein product, partial [Rotaria sp. Silwood1]